MSEPSTQPVVLKLPVAVHRWFADGEGWAYHSYFTGKVSEVVVALDRVLKSSDMREFVAPFGKRFLVGERVPDDQCKDPKAVHRRPFIVRAALLDMAPSDELAGRVRESLRQILPEARGESRFLKIRLPAEPPVPTPLDANGARQQELKQQLSVLSEECKRLREANMQWAEQLRATEKRLRRLKLGLWGVAACTTSSLILLGLYAAFRSHDARAGLFLAIATGCMAIGVIGSQIAIFFSRLQKASLPTAQSRKWRLKLPQRWPRRKRRPRFESGSTLAE